MADERLEQNIDPDPDDLKGEWVKQPRMRLQYGDMLADAKRDLSLAKRKLEVVEAELSLAIREHPEDYNLAKVTEASIQVKIKLSKSFQYHSGLLIDAQHDLDVIVAAVSAIDHRKTALGDLVALWLGDYYATPRAPKADPEKVTELERSTLRRGRKREV